MRFTQLTTVASLAGLAAAAPFSLPNGFPNPDTAALHKIYEAAGGTLPNTPLPSSLPADAVTTLQVVAFNELFEVAFFSSLLNNITNGVDGYTDLPMDKSYLVSSLEAIVAQEELHAYGANAILMGGNATTIPTCNYMFPATSFSEAIKVADTFTAHVLGALQGVIETFAQDGGNVTKELVPLFAAILGQEGEQNGAYRLLQGKKPSAAPFLTGTTGQYVFNAIKQMFVVPGSCDTAEQTIGLPSFDTLAVCGDMPGDYNTTVKFTTSATNVSASANSIAYISGQNYPVVVSISSVMTENGMTTFEAPIPFANGFAQGLSIAALVNTATGLMSAADVTAATVAGPGFIQVD